MSDNLIRFVHISDTHITPNDEPRHNPDAYSPRLIEFFKQLRGVEEMHPAPAVPASVATKTMVREINDLPFDVDFVLHTGDIMTDPTGAEEYDAASELLLELRAPVYTIPGNHDRLDGVRRAFGEQGDETYDYSFSINGLDVICIDSATHGVDHGGALSDTQLAWIEKTIASTVRPFIVAIHHPPVRYGIPFMDFVGMKNPDGFHAILAGARDRVRGVYSGHIHQGLDFLRDGVHYSTVQGPQVQANLWPELDQLNGHSVSPNPGFTVVTVTNQGAVTRRYTYALPAS